MTKNMTFANTIDELPGLDALGSGYDIFGEYANPKSVKSRLFDLGTQKEIIVEGKRFLIPNVVRYTEVMQGIFDSTFGKTLKEYSERLKTSVGVSGNYGFFQGSIDASFDKSTLQRSEYEYSTVNDEVKKWIIALPSKTDLKTKSLLDSEFNRDLNGKMNPEALFEKYGAYYLQEIVVGARCAYNSSVNKKTLNQDINVEITAKMSYKSFVNSISASEKTQYEQHIKQFDSNSTTKTEVLGGKPEYGHYINQSGNYDKWIESIIDYPVFSGFTDNSLVPIWELCSRVTRKNELKQAFSAYAEKKTVHYSQYCITNLSVIESDRGGAAPPYGFKKVDMDLNKGAGGKYIYLCYKEGLDTTTPITDIIVLNGKNANAPNGYTKINVDLNHKAGGKYIYFAYSRRKDKNPIRSVIVINGKNANAPYGYEKIDYDLNKGAGGDYLYLCYSRYF
ncbi:MAC/perforin domain-containing protein [Methanococcus sp. CF]